IRLLDRLLDGFGLVPGREDERELITPCCCLQGSLACERRIRQSSSHRGRLVAGKTFHVFVPPTSSPFKSQMTIYRDILQRFEITKSVVPESEALIAPIMQVIPSWQIVPERRQR